MTTYYSAENYRDKIYAERASDDSNATSEQGATPELPSSVDGGSDDEGPSDEAVSQTSSGESRE